MQKVFQEFRPFDSSVELNILSYLVLTLLTAHIANSYFLELSKRVPMKSESFNLFVSSFIQTLLLSIPSIILSSFFFTKDSQYTPRTNGFYILIVAGFSITYLALCLNRRLSAESGVLNKMIGLSILAINSCAFHVFDFQYKFQLHLLFTAVALIGLVSQFKSSYIFVTEPSASRINSLFPNNLLARLLFPFELVLENIIVIPDSRIKKYTFNIYAKLIASPIFFVVLAMEMLKTEHSIMNIAIALLISSLITALLIFCYTRKNKFLHAYGFISTGLLLRFIFTNVFEISENFSVMLGISKTAGIPLFLSPIIAIPSIAIQSYFIKSGFQQRTYFSIFYFVCFNLLISNTIQSYFLTDSVFYNSLRSTYFEIIALMGLLIFDVLRNDRKFTKKCWYYGAYCIMQECVILLIYR